MGEEKNTVPFVEGLFNLPTSLAESPTLIGSRCCSCGELYFPRKQKGLCVHCQKDALEMVNLSSKGTIAGYTVVVQPPAGGFYQGAVPYAYGFVDLPEGVRVQTQFAGDFGSLQVGGQVELVIEKLYTDGEGNEVVTYMFKPL